MRNLCGFIAIGISCSLLLSSCVTILHRKRNLTIDSYPQGASVYVDSKLVGETPLKIRSGNGKIDQIMLTKEGYENKHIYPSKKFNGHILWNFLFGSVGMLVDLVTNNYQRYDIVSYCPTLTALVKESPLNQGSSAGKVTSTTENTDTPVSAPNKVTKSAYATQDILNSIAISKSDKVMKASEIYAKYSSAVFMIFTDMSSGYAQGSGFFVSRNGIAVSNYHVFKGSLVGGEVIKLVNGNTYKVEEVYAYSEENDYILFKVSGEGFNYIPVTERGYNIGDDVYAIGSPKGLENTLSSGLISQRHKNNYIQISVPIDHGSSGGALINEYGEVIGITSGGMDDSQANLNLARDIRIVLHPDGVFK